MDSELRPLLSPVEAGAFLGMSPKTLANWRVRGFGPTFVKLGGRGGKVRYRRTDLEDFLDSLARQSTSDTGRAR